MRLLLVAGPFAHDAWPRDPFDTSPYAFAPLQDPNFCLQSRNPSFASCEAFASLDRMDLRKYPSSVLEPLRVH